MKQEAFLINKETGKTIKIENPKIDGLQTETPLEAYGSHNPYLFNITSESNATADVFKSLIYEIQEELAEKYKELDLRMEYALRNKIDKPIKGEITKGKLKWRGISLGVYKSDECIGYALFQRGAIVSFDFVNDKQYQIWRLRKLLEKMQEEWNQKPIDENSKEYKKFEEMANEYAELLADDMSQAFNTFHEMSEETAQTLETLFESLIIKNNNDYETKRT